MTAIHSTLICVLVTLAISHSNAVAQQYEPRVVIPRPFPAITNPKILPATDSDLAGSELVIGVVINGASRAYPINQLTGPRREIINDELGGTAIAATW